MMPLRRSALALAIAAALTLTACGSTRRDVATTLPAPAAQPQGAPAAPVRDANTGRVAAVQWPLVTIDRKEYRAAPGARVMSPNNLMMTPNQIPPNARVSFELDAMGQLRLIRVLPPDQQGNRVDTPRGPRTGGQ